MSGHDFDLILFFYIAVKDSEAASCSTLLSVDFPFSGFAFFCSQSNVLLNASNYRTPSRVLH